MGSFQPLSAGGHGELSSQSFLSSWKHCPIEGKALSLPTSIPSLHPQEPMSGYHDGSVLMCIGSYSQSERFLCLLSPSPGHPPTLLGILLSVSGNQVPGPPCPTELSCIMVLLWFHFCGRHKIPWVYLAYRSRSQAVMKRCKVGTQSRSLKAACLLFHGALAWTKKLTLEPRMPGRN